MRDEEYTAELDYCYECGGNGDDYHLEGDELVSNCPKCLMNPMRAEDD